MITNQILLEQFPLSILGSGSFEDGRKGVFQEKEEYV